MNGYNTTSFISSSLVSGADTQGYITTTSSPQVFTFTINSKNYILNSLTIEAHSTNQVNVMFNNDISIDYIDAGTIETLNFLPIKQITIVSPIGTKFRYKGIIDYSI